MHTQIKDLDFTIPLVSKDRNYTEQDIEKIFRGDDVNEVPRKDCSILERLLSNGYWVKRNLKRVDSYLEDEFKKKYRSKAEFTKKFCLNLIELN